MKCETNSLERPIISHLWLSGTILLLGDDILQSILIYNANGDFI